VRLPLVTSTSIFNGGRSPVNPQRRRAHGLRPAFPCSDKKHSLYSTPKGLSEVLDVLNIINTVKLMGVTEIRASDEFRKVVG